MGKPSSDPKPRPHADLCPYGYVEERTYPWPECRRCRPVRVGALSAYQRAPDEGPEQVQEALSRSIARFPTGPAGATPTAVACHVVFHKDQLAANPDEVCTGSRAKSTPAGCEEFGYLTTTTTHGARRGQGLRPRSALGSTGTARLSARRCGPGWRGLHHVRRSHYGNCSDLSVRRPLRRSRPRRGRARCPSRRSTPGRCAPADHRGPARTPPRSRRPGEPGRGDAASPGEAGGDHPAPPPAPASRSRSSRRRCAPTSAPRQKG